MGGAGGAAAVVVGGATTADVPVLVVRVCLGELGAWGCSDCATTRAMAITAPTLAAAPSATSHRRDRLGVVVTGVLVTGVVVTGASSSPSCAYAPLKTRPVQSAEIAAVRKSMLVLKCLFIVYPHLFLAMTSRQFRQPLDAQPPNFTKI
jgi:hypothetical protein